MFGYIHRLLDARSLSPHGFCLLWRPELLWTHVLSDAAIGLSYMTIPLSLGVILLRRRDIPFGSLVWCFAVFITACGMTHFMSIWTLWRPDYGVEALIKLVTAVASVLTAILMWRLIPLAVSLPSPTDLRRINAELEQRVAERDTAIAALKREQEERGQAEAALLQTQKLDALGQLTSGVAHDFNNLLQAIQGAFQMIDRRAAETPMVRQLAGEGLNVTRRGARLTAQLLAFSRSKQLKPEVFAIDALIADLHDMFRRTLGSTIDLRFALAAEGVSVLADRTQMELAMLNLLINARDAITAEGKIVLETAVVAMERPAADLAAGRYVEIRVRDDGAGMADNVIAKAFDPFFTTKDVGKGAGLGLSQVYGFAKQAGGAARIESREGVGTTIHIFVPVDEAVAINDDEATPPMHAEAAPRGHILVVDDDTAVRRMTVRFLEAMGHRVSEAADGATALTAIESNAPDLLVVDYAMPGMTGAELAATVRGERPALPILFVTGYADLESVRAVLGTDQVVLRKPYRFEELEQCVAEALNKTSPRSAAGGASRL